MRWKYYIVTFIRYALIILLVYAALNKWMDHPKFYNDLRNSPLLGNEWLSMGTAWAIPFVELLVALLLVFPTTRLKGLYAAFTLMLLFTLYITVILWFANHVPCSCGGIISRFTWPQHLIFNIGFTLLALLGAYLYPKKPAKTAKIKT